MVSLVISTILHIHWIGEHVAMLFLMVHQGEILLGKQIIVLHIDGLLNGIITHWQMIMLVMESLLEMIQMLVILYHVQQRVWESQRELSSCM